MRSLFLSLLLPNNKGRRAHASLACLVGKEGKRDKTESQSQIVDDSGISSALFRRVCRGGRKVIQVNSILLCFMVCFFILRENMLTRVTFGLK